MTSTSNARLIVKKEGPIAWIIFSNPGRLNAVTMNMWLELPKIARELDEDPSVRVIMLRGEGDKAFVSGADISEFDGSRASVSDAHAYDDAFVGAVKGVRGIVKPTIAVISGYGIGGGLGIAVSCDIRIASTDARMGVPAAKLCIGYPSAAVWQFCEVIGPSRTREVMLTAQLFTGPEALQMGLVNRLEKPSELFAAALALGNKIAVNAPLSIAASKVTIDQFLKGRDQAACDAANERCMASQDYIEGRAAFAAKRVPVFQGR